MELIDTMPHLEVYLMNTGRVGGPDDDERSKKVRIKHSSAVLQGIVEGSVTWEKDPDFGYLVARDLPGFEDPELLQPRRLYERQDRMDEYTEIVKRLGEERTAYLSGYDKLEPAVLAGLGG